MNGSTVKFTFFISGPILHQQVKNSNQWKGTLNEGN